LYWPLETKTVEGETLASPGPPSGALEMQAPPEGWYPALHVMPHVDRVHDGLPFCVPGHALPHVLQLAALVVTSTHEPLQFVRPPVQDVAHALLLHTCDGGHALEQ
jgi:hypothetical protein